MASVLLCFGGKYETFSSGFWSPWNSVTCSYPSPNTTFMQGFSLSGAGTPWRVSIKSARFVGRISIQAESHCDKAGSYSCPSVFASPRPEQQSLMKRSPVDGSSGNDVPSEKRLRAEMNLTKKLCLLSNYSFVPKIRNEKINWAQELLAHLNPLGSWDQKNKLRWLITIVPEGSWQDAWRLPAWGWEHFTFSSSTLRKARSKSTIKSLFQNVVWCLSLSPLWTKALRPQELTKADCFICMVRNVWTFVRWIPKNVLLSVSSFFLFQLKTPQLELRTGLEMTLSSPGERWNFPHRSVILILVVREENKLAYDCSCMSVVVKLTKSSFSWNFKNGLL